MMGNKMEWRRSIGIKEKAKGNERWIFMAIQQRELRDGSTEEGNGIDAGLLFLSVK